MSTIGVEELKEPEFRLLDKLSHQDLMPFVKRAWQIKSLIYYLFNGLCLLCGICFVALFVLDFIRGELSLSKEFSYFSYGVAASFLLIPFHEYLHVLAYKHLGAVNTSYDMNLRKFYFMAMADKFVVNAQEFRIIALTPFVVISALCLLGGLLAPGLWSWIPLGVFCTHSIFCSGDFALLNYMEHHKSQGIYTYDDKEKGESYFFIKRVAE
ncbi:MAG: DUF3267 domain-containing protein [Luteibaculum sp.]